MCELHMEQPLATDANAAQAKNSIGKFNSAEALYKSYCELQRDYTKKCQALKCAMDKQQTLPQGILSQYDEAVKKMPELAKYRDSILSSHAVSLVEAMADILIKNLEAKSIDTAEQTKQELSLSDEIKNKIFEEMLESFAADKPPKPFKNRGQIAIAPSHKPKNLNEATNMARQIIKTRRIN